MVRDAGESSIPQQKRYVKQMLLRRWLNIKFTLIQVFAGSRPEDTYRPSIELQYYILTLLAIIFL